jgi:hypothetical protein
MTNMRALVGERPRIGMFDDAAERAQAGACGSPDFRMYAVRNPGQAGSVIAEKFYAMALCRTRSGSQGTALASGIFRRAPR